MGASIPSTCCWWPARAEPVRRAPDAWPTEIRREPGALRVVWQDGHESAAPVRRAPGPVPVRPVHTRRGGGPGREHPAAAPGADRLGRDAGALPRRHGVDRRRDGDADGDRRAWAASPSTRGSSPATSSPRRSPCRSGDGSPTSTAVGHVPHRPGDLPGRLGALGIRVVDGRADRLPHAPGARRRRADPARA